MGLTFFMTNREKLEALLQENRVLKQKVASRKLHEASDDDPSEVAEKMQGKSQQMLETILAKALKQWQTEMIMLIKDKHKGVDPYEVWDELYYASNPEDAFKKAKSKF